MRLDRFIASHKAYSAARVRRLLAQRQVRINGLPVTDGSLMIDRFCRLEVAGEILLKHSACYLMLNKPPGCVSATQDASHPTLLETIEHPAKDELHIAGRLDFNTTGLVLLTNDGRWSHQLMHPTAQTPKRYWVKTEAPITEDYVSCFAEGMYFAYEDLWTRPAKLELLSRHTAELTLFEGRYHQVKRMFGRFNNRVLELHRVAIGAIELDKNLPMGAYRALTPEEIRSV